MTLDEFKLLDRNKQKEYYEILKRKQTNFYQLIRYRCEEDVQINYLEWKMQCRKLEALYGN